MLFRSRLPRNPHGVSELQKVTRSWALIKARLPRRRQPSVGSAEKEEYFGQASKQPFKGQRLTRRVRRGGPGVTSSQVPDSAGPAGTAALQTHR